MLLLSLTLSAQAADPAPTVEIVDGHRVRYQARQELDFEGVDVTGELVRPQGTLLFETRRAKFNPLIRLRADWNEELVASVDEVK